MRQELKKHSRIRGWKKKIQNSRFKIQEKSEGEVRIKNTLR